jgi:hypothetical protein
MPRNAETATNARKQSSGKSGWRARKEKSKDGSLIGKIVRKEEGLQKK